MNTINKTGLAILITQLEKIHDYRYILDINNPEQWIKDLANQYEIPERLLPAFTTYAEEYLQEPRGCLNESGAFWNDEDILDGISAKFRLFYESILDYVYPDIDYSNTRCVIEPSYMDTTTICVVANGKLVWIEDIKAWHFWFLPENILNELTQIAEIFKSRL